MARKSFTLNTEPHVAELGDVELHFVPEVMGDEFLDGYARIIELNGQFKEKPGGVEEVDAGQLRHLITELRAFLAALMVPESRARFSRYVVTKAGKAVEAYTDRAEAEAKAAGLKGATVLDESMQLPQRVLMELLEWCSEIYGGGRPPTSSTGSAAASPPRGNRGTATSPSKASTRARGR
ncbi:hypothetical protein ACFV1C_00635 [Streptomyces sp. NPDC059605]|uniref:hypothetical protein n=1 Tax=Streptomyces sp. NPDC059605 TaxID=3346882 RepID=UPI0036A0EC30